jgi:hypothetical protein
MLVNGSASERTHAHVGSRASVSAVFLRPSEIFRSRDHLDDSVWNLSVADRRRLWRTIGT